MKLSSALLLACAVLLGLMLLVPLLGLVLAIALPIGALLIWLVPIGIIALSDRTTGVEKAAWILAMVFLSWFACVFYFFLAPLGPRPDRSRLHSARGLPLYRYPGS